MPSLNYKFVASSLSRSNVSLTKLWRDEKGAVLSTELILVAVIVVIGLVVGLTSIRNSVTSELSDVSGSVQELNQSFSLSGHTYERDEDGNIRIIFADPPVDEGEFVPPVITP